MSKVSTGKIVVFGNQKGGVGKTTLSVGVASAWAEAGHKILFVDADPQKSASEQLTNHAGIEFAIHDQGNLSELLPEFRSDFNFIVVDTPAGVSESITSVLKVADLLVIPVKPSPYDFVSAEKTLALAQRTHTPAVFVINEAVANTRFAKQAREALNMYESARVLKQVIVLRSAHREVAAMGKAITEVNINGGKAAKEVRTLAKELLGILGE